MTTQAVFGTAALGLAVIALGLALGKKGRGRRLASVLLPAAIIVGTLRWVVRLSPTADMVLTIASLVLALAAVWDLYRRRDAHVGVG